MSRRQVDLTHLLVGVRIYALQCAPAADEVDTVRPILSNLSRLLLNILRNTVLKKEGGSRGCVGERSR
jgi:hypothetical protein